MFNSSKSADVSLKFEVVVLCIGISLAALKTRACAYLFLSIPIASVSLPFNHSVNKQKLDGVGPVDNRPSAD